MISPIYLTDKDLDILKKYEIGHGTDGSVYRVPKKLLQSNKGILFKLYHNRTPIYNDSSVIDEDGVKVYNKATMKVVDYIEPISYFVDTEEIRLRSKDAIYKAIERQKYISLTDLPKQPLYLNGHFQGCGLKEQHGTPIHYLSSLPMKKKLKIWKNITMKTQELVDHYIYPTELDNSPFTKTVYRNEFGEEEVRFGHSHILVTHSLNPSLIDLDGKSTIYTEHFSDKYYTKMIRAYNTLLIEFLFTIPLEELENELDGEAQLEIRLEQASVPSKYLKSLSSLSLNLDEVNDLLTFDFCKKKKLY